MALRVSEYETADGKSPFREWPATLDRSVRARVQARDIHRAQGYWRDYLEGT